MCSIISNKQNMADLPESAAFDGHALPPSLQTLLVCVVCQHEKLSSQLQLNQKKPPEGESSKSEVKPSEAGAAAAAAPVPVCEGATAKPPEGGRVEDKTTGESVRGCGAQDTGYSTTRACR